MLFQQTLWKPYVFKFIAYVTNTLIINLFTCFNYIQKMGTMSLVHYPMPSQEQINHIQTIRLAFSLSVSIIMTFCLSIFKNCILKMSHHLIAAFFIWQIRLLPGHFMGCGQLSHYFHPFPLCNEPTRDLYIHKHVCASVCTHI